MNEVGEPDTGMIAILEAVRDVERLEAIGELILRTDLTCWEDLLQ